MPFNKLKLLEIFNRIPLFKSLVQHEREQVLNAGCTIESAATGKSFIVEGTHSPVFYIVLSGSASVQHNGYQVGTIVPGQFIGEVGFICSEARTATVTALNDMLLLKITRQNFQSLPIKIRESIKDKVIEGLVERANQQNRQIVKLGQLQADSAAIA
ncbi:MAG: cyclic nucleotide-binding domain-containing protein [Algicola sp.]|nr:cyclic nucleotide-binding domain-containing protein [Algicola sp.]